MRLRHHAECRIICFSNEMKEELRRRKCKALQDAECVVERGGEITIVEWRCTHDGVN